MQSIGMFEMQHVMDVKLAFFKQFTFCCLVRFIIISVVHEVFHFPLMRMCKALELKQYFLKKCLQSFGAGIFKKLGELA